MKRLSRKIISLTLAIALCLSIVQVTNADVSNISLSKTQLELYSVANNYSGMVSILNCPKLPSSDIAYTLSNENMGVVCYFDNNKNTITIYALKAGTCIITFYINNQKLKLTLICKKIKINKTSLVLQKKKKATFKVKNYPYQVNWQSSNKKVATISTSGVVKGKKVGNALIYARIGNESVGCVVSVVGKKVKIAVKKAYSLFKGKYSQKKRMKKGYYDCSSLVWRAYRKAGIYIKDRYWAPTAAQEAKWYVKKKKRRIKGGYSKKNISKMKLRPGDLYFCEHGNSWEYRGIYHVEMFTGYNCTGFNQNGDAIIVAKWATVPDNYYPKTGGLMVRPVK